MATARVKIAVLIGDNGKFAVNEFKGEETDWGFMGDCLEEYDPKTRESTYPKAEAKYIVEAYLELPTIQTVDAASVKPA